MVQLCVAAGDRINRLTTSQVRVPWTFLGSPLDILIRRLGPAEAGVMSVKLNKQAVKHARQLIKSGRVVHDERDAWSEDALPAKDETAWLKKHSWDEYASWHLGLDTKATPDTKGRFEFPMGDYSKLHRCAVIAIESRAAQYKHRDIAKASKKLLTLIDKAGSKK
jgi:hypothetical protein